MTRFLCIGLLSLFVGCAASQPESSTAGTTPAAAAPANCDGCAKRPGGCMSHAEAGMKDAQGNPLAPTEGRDFPCDPSCCK